MSRLLPYAVVLLLAMAPPCVGARPTQQPKTRPVVYEKLGFTVNVPFTSNRRVLPVEGAVEVCDVFQFGELAFSVKVAKAPADTLTATAIEQTLQAQVAAAPSPGEVKRWELELPGGDLFKGLSGPLPPDDASPEAAYVRKAFSGRPAWRSQCMGAMGDESSPIVALGVAGSVNRSAEIENLAKFFAFGFSKKATGPSLLKPAKLGKGDIELVGSVESIDAENKSLNMIVDRVRMPNTGYIKLDPPRKKIVHHKKPLPAGIDVNSRISVIGFNTGVGNPIMMDVIALQK